MALGQVRGQISNNLFPTYIGKANGKYEQHKRKKNNTITNTIHASRKDESSDIWVRWEQLHDHHCVHKHQGT